MLWDLTRGSLIPLIGQFLQLNFTSYRSGSVLFNVEITELFQIIGHSLLYIARIFSDCLCLYLAKVLLGNLKSDFDESKPHSSTVIGGVIWRGVNLYDTAFWRRFITIMHFVAGYYTLIILRIYAV